MSSSYPAPSICIGCALVFSVIEQKPDNWYVLDADGRIKFCPLCGKEVAFFPRKVTTESEEK